MRVPFLAFALLSLTAGAAPKVALLKFTGPRAPQAREVLAAALCAQAECVEPEQVTTRFLPDWEKAAAQAVNVMVQGSAARDSGAVELTLVTLENGKEVGSQKVELPKEGLSADAVAKLSTPVLERLGLAPKPAPPPAEVVERGPVVNEEPVAAPVQVAATPAPPPPPGGWGEYGFSGELGLNAANRSFDYVGARVPTLREYRLPLVALLTARVEAFPFSRAGALGGLGFELGGNVAPWITSAPPASTNALPTLASRTDLAAQYRLRLGARLRLTPLGGVRVHTFTVMGQTAEGRRLDGLPNLVYVAVRAGVSGELKATEQVTVFARAFALPLLSASELLSAEYFPRGWALGVEATGGVGFKLFEGVEVRLSVDWTRYMFTFQTNPGTSPFFAHGAVDQYLGGTAVARFEL